MQPSSDSSETEQFTLPRGILRALLNRRTFRISLFCLVCLVTLTSLFYAVEDWRGKQAWEKFKSAWEARGEGFDAQAVIPKPVPPEKNFAMTPFLAPLLDYQYAGQPSWVVWRDSNAVARAQEIGVVHSTAGKNLPYWQIWARGAFTDLTELQTQYRASTNFPSTTQSQGPARDILTALSKYDSVFTELRRASTLPYSVFPVHYDEGDSALAVHLAVLKHLSDVLLIRAVAYLATEQTTGALADLELVFYLAESVKSEPLLISQLVRNRILETAMQPVWEGLAKHQWTAQQLDQLQSRLASIQLFEDYGKTMRGERAFGNQLAVRLRAGNFSTPNLVGRDVHFSRTEPDHTLALIAKIAPRGWIYQNQLLLNKIYAEKTLPAIDAARHRVYVGLCKEAVESPELAQPGVFNRLARLFFPALANVAPKFAHGQTVTDLAMLACALERYRIAEDQYPEKLGSLVPRFIASIPADVINGEPLKYRRTYDGQFVLYSVGWNEKDDQGEIALSKSKSFVDYDAGDCVWRPCGWAGISEGIKLAGQ